MYLEAGISSSGPAFSCSGLLCSGLLCSAIPYLGSGTAGTDPSATRTRLGTPTWPGAASGFYLPPIAARYLAFSSSWPRYFQQLSTVCFPSQGSLGATGRDDPSRHHPRLKPPPFPPRQTSLSSWRFTRPWTTEPARSHVHASSNLWHAAAAAAASPSSSFPSSSSLFPFLPLLP